MINCGNIAYYIDSMTFSLSGFNVTIPYYVVFAGRKFPTLLHVACFYGMESLFAKIIDSFCSLSTLNIVNMDLKTPGDLALAQGHNMLASLLENQLVRYT